MATQTQINVNVKVDDKQVNTAVKSTESLRKEIRKLEQELTRVEVGSKEFENLSEQLKDNKDKLEVVRAKSRDLFDSFSMLPGPIGQIGSGISSTSDKLKIFSSFNLKDIKGQFKAVSDDVKLVVGNLGKATGITKLYEATVGGLSKAFKFFGVASNTASTAAKGFGKALIATGIGAIVVAVGTLIANFDSLKTALLNLVPGLGKIADFVGGLVNKFTDFIGVTSEAERKQKKFIEGLESGLKKEKENWEANADKYDEFTNRKVNAVQKFKEKQIEILKDETKSEAQKNKLISAYREQAQREIDKADKDRKKKNDDAAKSETDRNDQKNQTLAQQDRQRRQEEQDAKVQNLKNAADTDEKALREALKTQYAIRNEGKKLTEEQVQAQADEINRIVQDELQKDIDARKKANDEKIKDAQDTSKLTIQTIDVELETLKLKYGEDSEEYRKKQKEKFAEQARILNEEESLLKSKEASKDGLTEEEKRRLKEIQNERQALSNTVVATNQAQVDSDIEKANKLKSERDKEFSDKITAAGNDFELQQKILQDRKTADEQYYAEQLAREGLTAAQIKAIRDKQLADQQANADASIAIEQKKFDAQQKLLQAIGAALTAVADIAGKNTATGKALAVAASLINTYSAIAGQLNTFSNAKPPIPIPGYAIIQAIATGLVGFKAVSDIIKTPVPSGSGGTGTPEKPRQLALGGMISGPGSGRSDLVPAMLSNGESVINAQSTAMFRPLLSSINAMGGGRRFADGGLAVGSFSQDQALSQLQNTLQFQQPPIKTYVVSSDMTSQQMMDRNIKERSTL